MYRASQRPKFSQQSFHVSLHLPAPIHAGPGLRDRNNPVRHIDTTDLSRSAHQSCAHQTAQSATSQRLKTSGELYDIQHTAAQKHYLGNLASV